MDALLAYVRSVVEIDDQQADKLLAKFFVKTVHKGELVLRKGQVAVHYIFINSGALRTYDDGPDREHTYWCFLPGDLFAEISSLHHRVPCRFNIQATEDTELFMIHINDLEILYKQDPIWQEFARKFWERMCINFIDQSIRFQTLSAEAMYLEFLKVPGLVNKIPVGQLATVLGITPNALSRIRKNISHTE